MRTLSIPLLAALLASPALAEWRNLDGRPLPLLTAKEWINTGRDEPTLADLRGKVFLLEFFATW